MSKKPKQIKLALVGAAGRMGVEISRLATADFGITITASPGRQNWQRDAKLDPKTVDVMVEFSSPEGLRQAVRWCVQHNKPLVSGTTGLTAADRKLIQKAAQQIPILHSANMSLGIAVMTAMLDHFKLLEDWDFQVDEVHHNQKKDRPSGTALALDRKLSTALKRKLPTPNSIRGGGVPGIHQVWAMGPHEVVVLQHTAFDRKVFARGALQAARWLFDKAEAGLYDISDLIKS